MKNGKMILGILGLLGLYFFTRKKDETTPTTPATLPVVDSKFVDVTPKTDIVNSSIQDATPYISNGDGSYSPATNNTTVNNGKRTFNPIPIVVKPFTPITTPVQKVVVPTVVNKSAISGLKGFDQPITANI